MTRHLFLTAGLVSAALLTTPLRAQETVDLQITAPAKPVRYTIESKSATEREVLVDGAVPEGRGRGMGGRGPTKSESTVVFDEGQDGSSTWRVYRKAAAKVETQGRDGEPRTNEIEGGMIGERLHIVEDDRGVVIRRGDADGDELPRMLAMGVTPRTAFAGITPSEPVTVGEEFEMPATFVASLRSLMHPVRPAIDPERAGRGGERPPRGGDAGEGEGRGERGRGQGGRGQAGRGQGGSGGDAAGGERGQRGARDAAGRFGGMRGMMGSVDTTLPLVASSSLKGKIVGKVVEVQDGIAKVELRGTREGDGAIPEISGGRGRRGRGGRGAGGNPAEGSAKLDLTGTLWVDVGSHSLVKLVLEGTSKTEQTMTARNDMEITTKANGTFRYAVAAEAAPADGDK